MCYVFHPDKCISHHYLAGIWTKIIFFWDKRNLMKRQQLLVNAKILLCNNRLNESIYFSFLSSSTVKKTSTWLFSGMGLHFKGGESSVPHTGCGVFIHLPFSMKFPCLSLFGGFIGIPSKSWFLVEMVDLLQESIPPQEDTFQTLCLKSEALLNMDRFRFIIPELDHQKLNWFSLPKACLVW